MRGPWLMVLLVASPAVGCAWEQGDESYGVAACVEPGVLSLTSAVPRASVDLSVVMKGASADLRYTDVHVVLEPPGRLDAPILTTLSRDGVEVDRAVLRWQSEDGEGVGEALPERAPFDLRYILAVSADHGLPTDVDLAYEACAEASPTEPVELELEIVWDGSPDG